MGLSISAQSYSAFLLRATNSTSFFFRVDPSSCGKTVHYQLTTVPILDAFSKVEEREPPGQKSQSDSKDSPSLKASMILSLKFRMTLKSPASDISKALGWALWKHVISICVFLCTLFTSLNTNLRPRICFLQSKLVPEAGLSSNMLIIKNSLLEQMKAELPGTAWQVTY